VECNTSMTPIPFHCHLCDRPTMNISGVCDRCAKIIELEEEEINKNAKNTKKD